MLWAAQLIFPILAPLSILNSIIDGDWSLHLVDVDFLRLYGLHCQETAFQLVWLKYPISLNPTPGGLRKDAPFGASLHSWYGLAHASGPDRMRSTFHHCGSLADHGR